MRSRAMCRGPVAQRARSTVIRPVRTILTCPDGRASAVGTAPDAGDQRSADARSADARSADARLSRPALSIRSAEGRRWSADLSGSGPAGLVIYGMGGIGKSTLARQIGARVCRRQAGRVVSVLSGEVSAASFEAEPAETDFIICDNFDDNLFAGFGPGQRP